MIAQQSIVVLAHDIPTVELPIPQTSALIGGVWIVAFSFAVVALTWKRPRFDPARRGRPLPEWVTRGVDSPGCRRTVSTLALLFTLWVVVAAVFGRQDGQNPLPGVFDVLLWAGLFAVSLFIGPVWRAISPVRTLYRLIDSSLHNFDGAMLGTLRYPEKWGYWPAALGLVTLMWLQLASPNLGTLTTIEYWLLGYVAVMMVGALFYGQRWFARADPFEALSVAVSRLSPFRRNSDTGLIAIGNPLDHLLSMPVRAGTLTVLSILLGATVFDSFTAIPRVEDFVYDHAGDLPIVSASTGATLLRTAGLLLFIIVVAVTFWLAARATGGVDSQQRRQLPGDLAHALIPIIVGYLLAHDLAYLVEQGQDTVILLADPLGRDWDLLGLKIGDGNYWLSQHALVLGTIKVASIVIGHVVAVVSVHDRALRLLPKGHQISGQLAMMLVMVGYTFMGLYLVLGA